MLKVKPGSNDIFNRDMSFDPVYEMIINTSISNNKHQIAIIKQVIKQVIIMNVIQQAIVDMYENNSEVTNTELITLLIGGPAYGIPNIDTQTVENTIVLIDRAIMEFSDGFVDDEHETEEENYARANKIISIIEDTREYFECVLEYMECSN